MRKIWGTIWEKDTFSILIQYFSFLVYSYHSKSYVGRDIKHSSHSVHWISFHTIETVKTDHFSFCLFLPGCPLRTFLSFPDDLIPVSRQVPTLRLEVWGLNSGMIPSCCERVELHIFLSFLPLFLHLLYSFNLSLLFDPSLVTPSQPPFLPPLSLMWSPSCSLKQLQKSSPSISLEMCKCCQMKEILWCRFCRSCHGSFHTSIYPTRLA